MCLLFAVGCAQNSVQCYIAPRASVIPPSGKVLFDIYWANESDRPAMIPPLESYWFSTSSLPPALGSGGGHSVIVDHPSRDRVIGGWSLIYDQLTIWIDAKPSATVVVSAEFWGSDRKFKSNTVVLHASR